ncbi:glycosyltransferase [Planococcus notacanthi]|uniref:Glycosyl transferase family 1 domain-containing protein n=1 Tax=Planococcus notacanthi TaxID=3035188 RepID=A0ABT7ZEU0_9BACL|nr:glycosyltransferase [Planococcus sp. APC 4016]MDN3425678.1 hypothetical protein [Planococcus sp. APC 4016]
MKIILVNIGPVNKYPPVLSVLNYLKDLGIELVLCTTDMDTQTKKICIERDISIIDIKANYEKPIHPLLKLVRMLQIKKKIWKEIDKCYDNDTVIWVFSDLALKHLGSKLLGKRYVLHMFELSKNSIYYRKFPSIALNTAKYAKKSEVVIQAEYNRAHIAQAWWELEKTPYILPNKPYNNYAISRNSEITNEEAAKIMNKLRGKKIILYQGVISLERPLDPFINAIDKLGDDYAFVIMSGGENIYKNSTSKNLYFIPFIPPPYHLEITSNAYIGILSYVPTKNEFSNLNALYCAPNKLYEYTMFGIPMIGNDIPGLSYIFNTTECGVCFESFNEKNIINAISEVEDNYNYMAEKATIFYENTDMREILSEITNNLR